MPVGDSVTMATTTMQQQQQQQPVTADSVISRLLVFLFGCAGLKQRSGVVKESQGVERELNVPYNQPHLVPPMKLVFYENMPNSPLPPPGSARRVSQWVSQGRDLASRASDRASLTVRRKLSRQSISTALVGFEEQEPAIRRVIFRPLQLSIYLPGNRLSDLPEFEEIDFTDCGEIQIPPKAFIRPQSECNVRPLSDSQARPAISMVGERRLEYWQQVPRSSAQRPPSACEGLSSHPTQWDTLPGLSRQALRVRSPSPASGQRKIVLPSRSTDSMTLQFPPVEEEAEEDEDEKQYDEKFGHVENRRSRQISDTSTAVAATPPVLLPSTQISYEKVLLPTPARLHTPHRTRISQWLSRSSTRSSFSTTTTQITSVTWDKQSNDQLGRSDLSPAPLPPQPQLLPHARSTSSSSIFSSPPESLASMTSMTTAPTLYSSRSRAGTIRSLGKQVTVVDEEEEGAVHVWERDMPDLPQILNISHPRPRTRSPGRSLDISSPLSFSAGGARKGTAGFDSLPMPMPMPNPMPMPMLAESAMLR